MPFRSEWKGVLLAKCIEDVSPRRSTVDVGILLGLGFRFIEFFVLVCLRQESLMPCFSVHDSIHDGLALK